MPPTTHCRVGPPMPGYLAVYGPPGPDGAEPLVALVPVTNANAASDAALFAAAWALLAELQRQVEAIDSVSRAAPSAVGHGQRLLARRDHLLRVMDGGAQS